MIRHRSIRPVLTRGLPLLVAGFLVGFVATAIAVLAWMLGGWLRTIGDLRESPEGPEIRLEGIGASHFVEKVRWTLDRLGVEYVETVRAGVLGILFLGRAVPRLHFGRGPTRSTIADSSEILRYLWGRYGERPDGSADFLRPTADRLALEERLDAYGVDLQRWIYHHILPERAITSTVWGAHDPRVPEWQRAALRVLYPALSRMLRLGLGVDDASAALAASRIESLLTEIDERLGARAPFLGGDAPDFTDFTFAALSSVWIFPEAFARGAAAATLPAIDRCPPRMLAERERWIAAHPRATAHARHLYAGYR